MHELQPSITGCFHENKNLEYVQLPTEVLFLHLCVCISYNLMMVIFVRKQYDWFPFNFPSLKNVGI